MYKNKLVWSEKDKSRALVKDIEGDQIEVVFPGKTGIYTRFASQLSEFTGQDLKFKIGQRVRFNDNMDLTKISGYSSLLSHPYYIEDDSNTYSEDVFMETKFKVGDLVMWGDKGPYAIASTDGQGDYPYYIQELEWHLSDDQLSAYVPPATKFETKDSGERQEFDTGSKRDTQEGKGRYDLLPPRAIHRLAQLFERGAVKYGDRNWERGQPLSRYLSSMIRHGFNYLSGDRSEDHLIAVAWNALCLVETEYFIADGKVPADKADIPLSTSK